MRHWLIVLACLAASCGGSSPTSPTTTPPAPTTYSLSGTVTNSSTGAPLAGASVTVQDGPNANRVGTTDGGGHYTMTALTQSGFTATATATHYTPVSHGVNLTSNQVADFALPPIPPFSRAGTGDTVFDMPTSVTRVRIQATYAGFSSNFIVKIAGRLVVNELIGTGWGTTTFDGTYLTSGGTTEIVNSSGVQWTVTEVRP